jgi:hypothetical protein
MKIKYNEYTETFRAMPSNVWIASVKNKKLVFDSWDGLAKDYYKKDVFLRIKVIAQYIKLKITKAL